MSSTPIPRGAGRSWTALISPHARRRPFATAAVAGGYGLLLADGAVILFMPNGMLPIWLAVGAAVLLSFDRRLGPLPAALLVMLAVPVGRGAEVGLPRLIGDIPVRPHDFVPVIGVLLSVPAIIRRVRTPGAVEWTTVVPIALFAAAGVIALGIGISGDQAMRDVIRDLRWWGLYGIGAVALLAGTPRAAVIRALVWGLSFYAVIVLVGLLMPFFDGGLKWHAYSYDPRLRLHYGQAIFLLPAAAWVAARTVRRPSIPGAALLALLSAAVAVTLTRTLLVGVLGVATMAAVWSAMALHRDAGSPRLRAIASIPWRHVAAVIAAVAVGIASGFGTYLAGTQIREPLGAASGGSLPTETRPVIPTLNRVFEETESTGVGAQVGGRLASYASAFSDTASSPVLGHGMGRLADVSWAWGGFRAHTEGSQPAVDNAYLTVGLKSGALGIAAFTAMMLWPVRQVMHRRLNRLRPWFLPAWLAMLGLTLIQSFAVSGYGPYAVSLLIVLPALQPRLRRASGLASRGSGDRSAPAPR